LRLADYLETSDFDGNPYKRFLKEQYSARRCALFHAKLSNGAVMPGDMISRTEFQSAHRRLGRLYAAIAREVTGMAFGGGSTSDYARRSMAECLSGSNLYVSTEGEFVPSELRITSSAFGDAPYPGIYQISGSWDRESLPATRIRRGGSVQEADGAAQELMWAPMDVDTSGADYFELVLQLEFVDARNLREWFA
jgi:hypothetical protein